MWGYTHPLALPLPPHPTVGRPGPSRLLHLSPRAAGQSHMARCLEVAMRAPLAPTSPRMRGEVDLRAEPWRSEANRVRGLVHKLGLAARPAKPDSFAALGIRPLPARGERWSKWLCLAPQDTNSKCDSPATKG